MGDIRIQVSSSSRRTWKYEVFLSFRGEDTRNGFTGFLFAALQRKGIYTFKDDIRLQKGDPVAPELLRAIEQSRISIVVFSKNYADSTWCLEELAKIWEEVISEQGYTVFPIFYDVDPSDVRKQNGTFKDAFDKHERNFSDNIEKVQRWRNALTQVGSRTGWDLQTKSELEVIDEIVEKAIRKLGHKFSNLANDLVGMQPLAEALENLLDLDSDDVRVIGIWGIPGVGKTTTLATVVYDWISHRFDACCVLLDASSVHRGSGVVGLQEQLLRELTQKEDLKIRNHQMGINLISERLRDRKSLIVVDDVDHAEQLEKLIGNSVMFGSGSRIIITSRDEHILRDHGVDQVYKVELFYDDEALQLHRRRPSKRDDPWSNNIRKLIHRILQAVQLLFIALFFCFFIFVFSLMMSNLLKDCYIRNYTLVCFPKIRYP